MERPHSGGAETEPAHGLEDTGPTSAPSVEALARTIAHAINNPLAALIASIDLAVEKLHAEPTDVRQRLAEARNLVEEAREAAERMRLVVKHLEATSTTADVERVLAGDPASGVAKPVTSPSDPRTIRILVVDDDELVRKSLRRALKDYDVVVLDSANEAAARIRAGDRFDLIVCDLMMPGVTGMDLHEEISRLVPEQAKRMVFLTGGAVTTRARDFVAAMGDAVIEKPFDVKELRKLVLTRGRR